MPLAAPLLIPFAEAVGLSIAGLGAIEIGKKVQDFISDNPETSTQILNMIVPGSKGLETLFKKKATISLEDVEDMTDEEAADLSKEDKAEIMKEVGKSKGGDKRQRMIEISEKLGLSGEGKEKQTIIDEVEERYDEGGVEDAPKPKFDYKKFFRNRNADGGAIGIEVLFEEKKNGGRIGFANGGDNIINKDLISLFRGQPLFGQTTNQALSSYPSDKMLSGRFFTTNPDIAKSYAKYSAFPSVVKEMKVPSNVLNQAYNFKDRLTNFPTKTFADLPQRKDVLIVSKDMLKNYKPSINIPATLSSNFNQGLGFLKNNAIKALTAAGSLPFQAALATLYPTPVNASEVNMGPEDFAALNSRTNVQGMDLEMDPGARINPDIQPQQNIFQRAGNVFSSIKDNIPNFGVLGLLNNLDQFDNLPIEDRQFILDQAGGNRPSKDPFGINRRSALGNYADYVRNKGIFAPGKRGEYYRSLNIPGLDTAMKETVAREQIAKRAYEKQIRDAADAASRNAARARSITAGYGGSDDSRGATGPTASGAGMGVGGGYASDYGFAKGGLATMFVEKR